MLRFESVDVAIEGAPVLRSVSFALEPGATVALIGPNGAGKTTCLRSVMGFTRLEGRIFLGEREITGLEPHLRPGLGIGYAPEDRRLFSAFSVEDNITLPARVAGHDAAEVERRLEEIKEILPEVATLARRPAGTVSGGQGKMVALARALMIGTELVLLDEPFQGLAPALARRYAESLRALRERNDRLTLVITESNPALLEGFADRVLVIERGEVEEGSIDRLKELA